MTGLDLIVLSTAGAAGVLLVLAGAGHVRHRRQLVATLAAQRTLPHRAQAPVAATTGPAELALGAGLLASLVLGAPAVRVAGLAGAALYLVLGVYIAVVWRTRPGVPCGCFAGSGPASGWTVLRALLLGLGCLAAGLGGASPTPAGLLAAAGGALVLTGVFWLLPELAGIGG